MLAEQAMTQRNAKLNHRLEKGPKWLVLGVNNTCNLHCKMCDVGTKSNDTIFSTNLTGTRPLDMPLELFETIVSQAAQQYPDIKLGYAFTEPLIYRYLEESLALTQRHGLHTSITTNALKLREKADQITRFGVQEVFVSLDGTQDIHNDIRGHRHSFQRAIEGMETLFSLANAPRVSVFCVITEWNIGTLAEFVSTFQQYPLEHIGFMHPNFTSRELAAQHNAVYGDRYVATHSNIEEMSIDNMDLDLLWDDMQCIEAMQGTCPVTFSPDLQSRAALDTFYKQPSVFIGRQCHDIFSNMMVKSDGSVIPAHGRCYNYTVGNVYDNDLRDIWNSLPFSQLRQDVLGAGGFLPACSRCCSAFSP